MPTVPPSPMASALAWLRTPMGRARRWLAARGPVTRIGLLLIALAALGAVGYFSSLEDPSERALDWLYAGRKLSNDDLNKISEALDVASIPHVTDPSGRVGVKPARRAEALLALEKAKVVPRTLDDLSRDSEVGNWFDGPEERQQRELARLERSLKYQIEALDASINSAYVKIIRTRARAGLNAPWNVSAYVHLTTESGRRPTNRVVEGIETFLKGTLPDLKPEAITVADQSGYSYLAAGNPTLKEEMKTHALEETWREKITEALQHIPGVSVSVLLETVQVPPPPPQLPPPGADEVVKPNGSVVIDPEPPIDPQPHSASPTRIKANVWVRVPRSFYLLEFQQRSPNRQPTQDDLEPMRVTTERLIHDAVEINIPKDDLGVIKVGVIQDDLVASRPILVTSVTEAHRPWAWVALSGTIVFASVVSVAALVRLATRRPVARPSRSAWRPGYVADGPSGPVPGPSERVRELIRLNPEAAAGVLQRWIGQGGALP